jgi:RNA polymerase sigma-70 factor (ECF subfamily)
METDRELLKAARRMDQRALVQVFDRYAPALFKYALRLCGDAVLADQIVGDVFVKLLEQFAAGNGPQENLRSYLYETTYHRLIDESRAAQRKAPLEVATSVPQNPHPAFGSLEDQIIFKQILETIRQELTDDQRHVIVLRFLEEFSLRETAAIMGKTVNHVKVIQTRAIAALRRSLKYQELRNSLPAPDSRGLFQGSTGLAP